jgi:biopolymer transport protein TolR
MGFKLKKPPREEAEMDITPMIDCTFLLLIFFVLTSKMDASKALELPVAKHGTAAVEKNCVIIIVMPGDGGAAKVYLSDKPDEGKRVTGAPEDQDKAISAYVVQEIRAHPEKKSVIVKASAGVKHREVSRVAKAAAALEEVSVEQLFMGIVQEQK